MQHSDLKAAPSASAPRDAPRRLGRYELLEPIASGGMATVYLARAAGIGGFERLLALKVCHPHLAADAQFAAMFLDEARLAARIHHPNVAATLDVGDEGGLFFAMEYVDGPSLADWLRTAPEGLPTGVALRVLLDALAGLSAAHELRDARGEPLNLVHRDVSPQNLLVGRDGVTRLVDFGIAKAEARLAVTRGREVKGKFGYMPPEQFLGQAVGRRADVWAAGAVLWEAIVGQRLFRADSDAALMNLVLRGQVEPLPERDDVSAGLRAAIAKALARKPEDRHPTAAAFAEALERSGAPVASHREVAAAVERRCTTWLADRGRLEAQARTRAAPGGVGRATTIARVLEGSVLLVPRWVAVAGALAVVVGVGGAVLAFRAPPPAAAPAAPEPVPAPPVPALVAPAVMAPAPVTPPADAASKPRPGKRPRPAAKRPPTSAGKREFRPTEL